MSRLTNHDNPGSKTSPHATEAQSSGGITDGGALGLVHVGDNGVSWVGNDGTEDTGDVTLGQDEIYYYLVKSGEKKVNVPAAKVTTNCSDLEHCSRGLGTTCW